MCEHQFIITGQEVQGIMTCTRCGEEKHMVDVFNELLTKIYDMLDKCNKDDKE